MVAHALLEDHVARLAERLRAIHRGVGVAQQLFRVFVVAVAPIAMPMLVVTKISRPLSTSSVAEARLHPLGNELHVAGAVDTVEQDRELVAAEPRQHVAGRAGTWRACCATEMSS